MQVDFQALRHPDQTCQPLIIFREFRHGQLGSQEHPLSAYIPEDGVSVPAIGQQQISIMREYNLDDLIFKTGEYCNSPPIAGELQYSPVLKIRSSRLYSRMMEICCCPIAGTDTPSSGMYALSGCSCEPN